MTPTPGFNRPEFSAVGYAPRNPEPVPYGPWCMHSVGMDICIAPAVNGTDRCIAHAAEFVKPKTAPELKRKFKDYSEGKRTPPLDFPPDEGD